jgi:hypothetical protein
MQVSFGIADGLIIAATLLGPILAVQAQRLVDTWRERQQRRLTIFRVLMATRAASLSGQHVEALNAIPIEFYGRKRNFTEVVNAWRSYLDHLSNGSPENWGQRRQDLFIELLWKLAVALGYEFSKVQLQREVYSPAAHGQIETEQEIIRKGLTAIFKGEAAFPLDIKSMAVDPQVFAKQQQVQDLLLEWMNGKSDVKVQLVADPRDSAP